MLIIRCFEIKKSKAQVSKNKNDKKVNTQMSKDENGMKCKC